MGKGWIAAEGKLDVSKEGRKDWPTAEIERAGPANIRMLVLNHNELTSFNVDQLARLSCLDTLYFEGCQLTALPAEMAKLSKLKELSLTGNRLTEVPAAVWQLSTLQQLYLNRNQLAAVPAEIGRLSALRILWLHDNNLTALPPEMGRLSALQDLQLSGNKLARVPAEIGKLKALKYLGVKDNPLTDLPESARADGAAVLAHLRSLPPLASAAPSLPSTSASATGKPAAPPAPTPPAPAPSAPAPSPAPASAAAPKASSSSPPDPKAASSAPAPGPSASNASPAAASAAAPKAASSSSPAAARDPRAMRVADLSEWLRELDLGKFAPKFEDCSVDGMTLLTLTDADLREELGIESAIVRRKTLAQIAELARPHGLPVAGPAAPPARPQSARKPPAAMGDAAQHPAVPAAGAEPKAYDCFISYAHADKDRVLPFVDKIEAAGFSVWIDRELLPGRDWLDDIGKAIRKSRCFVAFVSPAYLRSRNCDDELKFAHHQVEPRPRKYPVWLCDPKSPEVKDVLTDGQKIMLADNWVTEQQEGPALQFLLAGLRSNLRRTASVVH